MKRILSVLFVMAMTLAMAACSSSDRNSREAKSLFEELECTHTFTVMRVSPNGIYRVSCEETDSGFIKSVLVVH